jgi:DNA polymerase
MHLDTVKDVEGSTFMKALMKPIKRSKKAIQFYDYYLWRTGEYCKVDVAAEADIVVDLDPLPKSERELWLLDQRINLKGLPLDRELVFAATDVNEIIQQRAQERLSEITNGAVRTPGQIAVIADWIEGQTGERPRDMTATTVQVMLDDMRIDPHVAEVLRIRQDAGTSAIKKFKKMKSAILHDPTSRFRGGYVFYGAHTGRWTGKVVQPTNLPRMHYNSDEEVDTAIKAIKSRSFDRMETIDKVSLENAEAAKKGKGLDWTDVDDWRPSATNCLTKCVRSAIAAPEGKVFVAADFSGIELRLLTWFVRDEKRLSRIVEKGSSQLYIDMAEKVFGRQVSKEDTFRYTVGKAGRLGCGYQMGSYRKTQSGEPMLNEYGEPYGGFIDYAKGYGVTVSIELADRVVNAYRHDNKLVKNAWRSLQWRVNSVVEEGMSLTFNGVRIGKEGDNLYITLPSGRKLWYVDAGISSKKGHGGKSYSSVYYYGDKQKKWTKLYLYGGLELENIIQAMSRDLLCPAMVAINKEYDIVSHTYDEIVCEVDEDEADECADYMRLHMCKRHHWCRDLPLDVDMWTGKNYKK